MRLSKCACMCLDIIWNLSVVTSVDTPLLTTLCYLARHHVTSALFGNVSFCRKRYAYKDIRPVRHQCVGAKHTQAKSHKDAKIHDSRNEHCCDSNPQAKGWLASISALLPLSWLSLAVSVLNSRSKTTLSSPFATVL